MVSGGGERMLIDTGWRPSGEDSGPERRRGVPWRALLWPALIVGMFVAGIVVSGWAGVALVYGAAFCGAWRATKAIPDLRGLKDHRQ